MIHITVPCFSIMSMVTLDSPADPSLCHFSWKLAFFPPILHFALVLGKHVGSQTRKLKQSVQPAYLTDQVMVKVLVVQLHGPSSVFFIF